ncbi:hypothetical protein BKA70DRAFT_1220756 [Coprinopsis sp. MPI-PUGE-AT-0042]|nr:hypothetical protein BKA70DRAFT_1220756 [Coprinopsis sp. MPI-PUGE-AT-0042]
MTSQCCKVYKVFQNVPQLKKIMKALKDLTRELKSQARRNFTPEAKSVGVPIRIDEPRESGTTYRIVIQWGGRLWKLCLKPKARHLRVGRGKFVPKAKSVGVPGRGRIDEPRKAGWLWELCLKPKGSRVLTRAFTNDFGTCPASGPAPQSRAQEVRPKSKVGRGAESGRSRIDEPRESGTICGIGIQSGRKGQVFRGQNVRISVLPSPRDRFVRDRTSAGNAIARFRAGVGPLESY